ncbi:hypothetical protein WOLCODRAFT_167851 [Wolfiporia cocos MD-104 SS10]|uniref:Peptidase A1 domain-containing protein n=1 Tax=Wolfiporia cocos (strain MD-104) TaxID=742152 RepID=A0A2H3JC96_WOLCO|nr:hypothetical protein WOLCODRAFT_167851 [Wolfiporia cocos MD-104 SS10]
MDNLYSQDSISEDLVAISFEPTTTESSTNGELTFGGTDSSKYTGSINYVQITTTSPANEYWGIDQSVTYGSSGTPILSETASIVDTGTTLILLTSDTYSAYQLATSATADETTGLLHITKSQYSDLESLYFNIGGVTYKLTANAQIWPHSLNSVIGGSSDYVYLVVGSTGEASGSGLDFIDGYAFLERFYSVFDTGNSHLLSESLTYVSTIDPTDPILPTDPYTELMRKWNINELELDDESLRIDQELLSFIRMQLLFNRKEPTSECWDDDVDVDYWNWMNSRPISPVMTTKAVRETPKPGSKAFTKMLPQSQGEIIKANRFNPVPVEENDDAPHQSLDDALGLKFVIEGYQDVHRLLESVQGLSRTRPTPDQSRQVQDFLRSESPPITFTHLDTPPIFARDQNPGYKKDRCSVNATGRIFGIEDTSDLPSLVPKAQISDDEEELYKQHMVVVDGWHAYETVSSPTAGSTPSMDDSSNEINKLFLQSSDDGGIPLVQYMANAQMDEYQIPRAERINGSRGKPKMLGEGQSLASFLGPLLSQSLPPTAQAKIVTTPKSHPSSPRTAITMSMLGQPSTVFDDRFATLIRERAQADSDVSDCDLDATMEKLGGQPSDNLQDLIMKEKLDEKDSLLMELPTMRPPNKHKPNNMFLPICLADLVASTKAPTGSPPDPSAVRSSKRLDSGPLKMVKGIKALNIELAWRPFKYGSSIPTDEETVGFSDDPQTILAEQTSSCQQDILSELSRLLEGASLFSSELPRESDNIKSMREWLTDSSAPTDALMDKDDPDAHQLILTRNERMRARGLTGEDSQLDSSDKENEQALPAYEETLEDECRPTKRHKAHEEETGDYYAHQPATDDSGVFLISPAKPQGGNSGFGYLASNSKGFEGPATVAEDRVLRSDGAHSGAECYDDNSPVALRDPVFDGSNGQEFQELCDTESAIDYMRAEANQVCDLTTMTRGSVPIEDHYPASPFDSTRLEPVAASRLSAHASGHLPISAGQAPYSERDTSASRRAMSPVSARLSLSSFLRLVGRRKAMPELRDEDAAQDDLFPQIIPEARDELAQAEVTVTRTPLSWDVPAEMLDSRTLSLPPSIPLPNTVHRYMASLGFIQKRALVLSLESRECAVELVERDQLGSDVDLIVDPYSAITTASLAALPSQVGNLDATLAEQSWRFDRVLVIFEAYPSSLSVRAEHSPRPVPYPFWSAVIKAVKKLRRNFSIAEACGTRRPGSETYFAFARTMDEAARYVRQFGSFAEQHDTSGGAIWNDRAWLDLDEQEGEHDLSNVDGMNVFIASIILSQTSLDDFLDLLDTERVRDFAHLIGSERMDRFNTELAQRAEAVYQSSSPTSAAIQLEHVSDSFI